jgi:hypothetical protein
MTEQKTIALNEGERAHKVMTPDEYLQNPLQGWHEVCWNVDDFDNVGVRYQSQQGERDADQISLDAAHEIECLPSGLPESQKTARIQQIVQKAIATCDSLNASSTLAATSSDQPIRTSAGSSSTAHATTLPENVRIPLDSLWADSGYLIGRIIADGSCGSMVVKSIRDRLDQIKDALHSPPETKQPRPIEDAPQDQWILAYFGPTHADWYKCKYDKDEYARRGPKPYWVPAEARYLGIGWARSNQPKVWLPLPAAPDTEVR